MIILLEHKQYLYLAIKHDVDVELALVASTIARKNCHMN